MRIFWCNIYMQTRKLKNSPFAIRRFCRLQTICIIVKMVWISSFYYQIGIRMMSGDDFMMVWWEVWKNIYKFNIQIWFLSESEVSLEVYNMYKRILLSFERIWTSFSSIFQAKGDRRRLILGKNWDDIQIPFYRCSSLWIYFNLFKDIILQCEMSRKSQDIKSNFINLSKINIQGLEKLFKLRYWIYRMKQKQTICRNCRDEDNFGILIVCVMNK